MCISLVRMSVCVHFSQMFCVFALHARAILNFFFLLLFVRSFCIHMHSRRETDRYDISMPMVFLYRHGSGYFFICFFCSLRCPYMQRPELKIMICFTSFKWCCVCAFFFISFRLILFVVDLNCGRRFLCAIVRLLLRLLRVSSIFSISLFASIALMLDFDLFKLHCSLSLFLCTHFASNAAFVHIIDRRVTSLFNIGPQGIHVHINTAQSQHKSARPSIPNHQFISFQSMLFALAQVSKFTDHALSLSLSASHFGVCLHY